MKKLSICLVIIMVLFSCITFNQDNTITVQSKEFNSGNNKGVTYRELSLVTSISYMPVPAKCIIALGASKSGECKLSDYLNVVEFVVESIHLYNYASISEMDDWKVVDYVSIPTTSSQLDRRFYAFTLQKDDNIVIVYRGTDVQDIFEWIQDFKGGITNINEQEGFAEEYALKIAKKYNNSHIYITGHSLGGYLTQIGASALEKAIENGKTGSTDWDGWNLNNTYNINDYTEDGKFTQYKNVKLEQAVSYNGIGMNVFTVMGELKATQDKKIEVLKKLANSVSSINNEPRLIAYNVKGDIISSLGLQYGEVREIYAPIDTITNYKRFHQLLNISTTEKAEDVSKLIDIGNIALNVWDSLNLLKKEVREVYSEYNVGSNIGSIILAHKMDSSMCSLEGANATPTITVVEKKIVNDIPYVGAVFSKEEKEIYSNKETTLIAEVSNACARKYVWYSCNENGENCVEESSSELSNEYVISDKNKVKYMKVKAYYDDSYQKRNLTKVNVDGRELYTYTEGEKVIPHSGSLESNLIKVVYDTVAPKCNFSSTSSTMYRTCSDSVTLTCTDNLGLESTTVTSNSFKNNKILDYVDITTKKVDVERGYTNFVSKINLKAKLVTSFGAQKIQFSGVKDMVGNISNSPTTSIKVKAKWFNKCS